MAKPRQLGKSQERSDEAGELRRALDALRESEERFRAVVDSANEGILVYDRALNVVAGNRAAERVIGLPLAELVGKPGFTSQLPCVREDGAPLTPDERPTRITIRTGQPLRGQVLGIQRPDGSTTWVEVNTGFLRRGGDPDFYGIVSTLADISERKRAEAALRESEERFRLTFELAGSGIAHVDMGGRLVRANPSLCEMLGYAEDELRSRTVKDLSHPEDRDLTDVARDRMRAGLTRSFSLEKRYVHKDGHVVWVDLTATVVRDVHGRPLHDIAIFDDITERKKAEAELRAAHDELKRSNEELAQFAYVASHDLQEPLRMVSSYTQLLARRYGERLDGDAREFMAFIVDGAARMKQLIEDLLAYSRVGTRGKDFRPMAVDAALRRALFNLKGAVEEAGASITYGNLPQVVADELQLTQLFQNLIGNALKFRSASVPRVDVSCIEKEAEWELRVSDNGIGIDPQYSERIFMVFQRLHNKAEYPGTGIGLAICKKVVERHGGRIWVSSKPGEGATFHFTLPKERQGHDR
jgi:PAS domain S-box-containing protein